MFYTTALDACHTVKLAPMPTSSQPSLDPVWFTEALAATGLRYLGCLRLTLLSASGCKGSKEGSDGRGVCSFAGCSSRTPGTSRSFHGMPTGRLLYTETMQVQLIS